MEALRILEKSEPYTEGRLNPKNDFLFKKLFADEEDKSLLISLLNSIMHRDGRRKIADITIIENKVLTPDLIDDKTSSLDVLCETDARGIINVEMQIRRIKRMDYRSLYYASRLFTQSITAGQDYGDLKRTVGINLLDHHYLPLQKFHNMFHLYEDEQRNYLLTDILELHFLEFPKFRKVEFDIHNPLHRWMRFLEQNTTPEQLKEMMKMDRTIHTAETRMSYLASDEETRLLYEAREKALHDRASWLKDAHEEGLEKGLEKGLEQGLEKTATALSMMLKGVDDAKIIKTTGLTSDEINKIKMLSGIES